MRYRRCDMPTPVALRRAVATMILVGILAGCAGGATGPSPTARPGPVTTPADALSRVITTEPRLTGIRPFDTGLIGQASWYTVEPASGVGAFIVGVRIGWGDCPAGCINEHSWGYAIGPRGEVSLLSEAGEPVPPDAWPSPFGARKTGIGGVALAGPVCPVERIPPDPTCAPRPVANATIVIRDPGGLEVARIVTVADGSFFTELAAGDYLVEPQPVEGLMGTAPAANVTVFDGQPTSVQLDYDTGIR